MAMDIDPFSMLEVSLQEGPEIDDRRPGPNASSGVMHQVENDLQVIQPPPPLHYFGSDILTPQRAVLSNIQKLSATSKDEEKFRRRAYSSISLVLRKRLHCTICDAHIGAYLGLKDMDIEHPLLKVLACPKCTLKYHYLDFPLSVDGRDVRCRWCTNIAKEESPLRYCSYCPFAFCEMCIYRNLPLDELASNKNNWVCFVCNVKDLWPSRAVLWALRVLIDTNLALKEEKKWSTDQSTCCKNKVTKQRRVISLPQVPGQRTNGHNVAIRAAILPNQFRMTTPSNYRVPQPRLNTTSIIRPVVPPQQTAYRQIRPAVQVVRPVTIPVPAVVNSSSTQLYDTSWLTEKVGNISTTLLNLNNNLHRLAQGIPEKENKYSIKSKMISMVSLLNISATQLQKASKEMEEESKRILDKNCRPARITPIVSSEKPPVASTSKPVSLGKRPPPRSRSNSSKRIRRRYRGSRTDSDSDPDDPDFRTKAKVDGISEDDNDVEEDETSRSSTRSYETRACFVKLERLDYKYVAGYDPGSDSETMSGSGNRFVNPQPSTSSAPDPLGTVPPSELPDRSDADSGGGEGLSSIGDNGGATCDPAMSKESEEAATLKETDGAEASKESDVPGMPKETDGAEASKEADVPGMPKETDGAATSEHETDTVATSENEVDAAVTSKETDAAIASILTGDSEPSKETVDSEESNHQSEPTHAELVTVMEVSQSDGVDESDQNEETGEVDMDESKPPSDCAAQLDDACNNKEEEYKTSSVDTSAGESTLDTSGDTSKSDSTEADGTS